MRRLLKVGFNIYLSYLSQDCPPFSITWQERQERFLKNTFLNRCLSSTKVNPVFSIFTQTGINSTLGDFGKSPGITSTLQYVQLNKNENGGKLNYSPADCCGMIISITGIMFKRNLEIGMRTDRTKIRFGGTSQLKQISANFWTSRIR
jgi:hypothetical protein